MIKRLVAWVFKFMLRLLDQALGTLPNLIRANLIIKRKLDKELEKDSESSDPRLQLGEDVLRNQSQSDMKRLERIEEKAKSTVLGLALSVSISALGIIFLTENSILADESTALRWGATICLCLSVVFLLVSGYLALSGYRIIQVYQQQLEDHVPLMSSEEARRITLKNLDLNRLKILQKENIVSACMDCLRNGLFLILIFILVIFLATLNDYPN